jgi:hypothetical protein
MNPSINEQSLNSPEKDIPVINLEAELHELEDTYAQCLGDDVDAKTLTQLWMRIKAIKKQMALNQ